MAERYAAALFDLAEERKLLDEVAGDLRQLRAMLAASADLLRLVRSPILSRLEQGRAIAALAQQAQLSPLVRDFLAVVAKNRRLFVLSAMIEAYLARLALRRGEVGAAVTTALLDLFNDKIVSVDYDRDQGFLEGMGIDVADPKKNGDEAKTGKYTGGKGGDYTIVCNEPSNGAEDGGRTAMENCLSKNPKINVVYTINEPAAVGANTAFQAAGVTDAIVVSVDGGCAGVKSVKDGIIGATAQQYPLKMATMGMEAVASIARGGAKPTTSEGLDFFNTGVALVTDKPAAGVDSITSTPLRRSAGADPDVVVQHLLLPPSSLGGGRAPSSGSRACCTPTRG